MPSRPSFLATIIGMVLIHLSPSPAQAQFEWLLGGGIAYFVGRGLIDHAHQAVDESTDRANIKIKERLAQAGDLADQVGGKLVEQAGNELRKTVKEAGGELHRAIDHLHANNIRAIEKIDKVLEERTKDIFNKLEVQQRQFFLQLDALQHKVARNSEDIVYLALHRGEDALREGIIAMERLPRLGAVNFKIQYVRGQYQTFKNSGHYYFQASGYGLSQEFDVRATMNGEKLEEEKVLGYSRVVKVPVTKLNSRFKNEDRVDLNDLVFSSNEIKEQKVAVCLLPKFPVNYRLYGMDAEGRTHRVYVNSLDKELLDYEQHAFARAGRTELDFALHRTELGRLAERRLRFGTCSVDWPYSPYAQLNLDWTPVGSGLAEELHGPNDRKANSEIRYHPETRKLEITIKVDQYNGPLH